MPMDKQSIAARIRALLEKTTENGCTEAEAMAAAAKARELMDRYNIERGSVGMEQEGVYTVSINNLAIRRLAIVERLATKVAAFCDCRCWQSDKQIKFFGLRSDADFAVWLCDSLYEFLHIGALTYTIENPSDARVRWDNEKAFVVGAVQRINERLNELTRSRMPMAISDGRALVVVKNAIVEREFCKLGMRLRTKTRAATTFNGRDAYAAGKAAGDSASFGRPVASATKMIGDR